MILPDKITPPKDALIYKALKFHTEYLEQNNSPERFRYSLYQDLLTIDEYIEIMDVLFLLGFITNDEVNITNDNAD